MRWIVAAFVGSLIWAPDARAAEDLPAPKANEPAPAVTPEQFAEQQKLVGDRPRPAPAQPLPAYPYAGSKGISASQLAVPPGQFKQNVPLPGSVPGPVLMPELTNVPFAPPWVSPAFIPRTMLYNGHGVPTTTSSTDAGYPTAAVTGHALELNDLTLRLGRYNTAVADFEAQLTTPRAWTPDELQAFDLRLRGLREDRAALELHLSNLPAEQRDLLAPLASLDRLAALVKQAHANSEQD